MSQTTGQENRSDLEGHRWNMAHPRCNLTESLQDPPSQSWQTSRMAPIRPVICFYMTQELRMILIVSMIEKVKSSHCMTLKIHEFQMWVTIESPGWHPTTHLFMSSVAASLSWQQSGDLVMETKSLQAKTAYHLALHKKSLPTFGLWSLFIDMGKPIQYMIKWKGQVSK